MDALIERLGWSVRALAQPAEVQATLFPPFVQVADELALDFDEHFRASQPSLHRCAASVAIEKLTILDAKLESMSGPGRDEVWFDDGYLTHPEWDEVRRLAKDVCRSFGWSEMSPSPCDAIYVGPGKEFYRGGKKAAEPGATDNPDDAQ